MTTSVKQNLDAYTTDELKIIKEVVDCLIVYSQAAIIRNNFVKNFYLRSIKKSTGYRLQGSYNIFGAKSFRLTSNSPNLLNMPSTGSPYAKTVKQCLTADPGWIIYQIDYQGLEDRVLANLSLDKNKCAIFQEQLDGHCMNSYYYYKEEIEKELPRRNNESVYEYIKRYYQEVENGNKTLKGIRQKSKGNSFLLAYGGYPPKLSKQARISLEEAKKIFNRYHKELYSGVSEFREKVLKEALQYEKIHLGLSCFIHSKDPDRDIRTLTNACCQFWSILSLLTCHQFNHLVKQEGYQDCIEIISTIYDSVYIHLKDDVHLIKWVNDTVVPIMTKPFLVDQVIQNEVIGEIGYNWYDCHKLSNNASLEEIESVMRKLNTLEHTHE